MGTLSAFLKGNAKPIENVEKIVSKRFINENGEAIPWILKKITAQENNILRKKNTKKIKDKTGTIKEEFNSDKYQEEYITKSVIFPDLDNTELQRSYEAMGAYDLLQKMLTAEEFVNLQIEVAGYAEEEIVENSMDNLVEEVKNE